MAHVNYNFFSKQGEAAIENKEIAGISCILQTLRIAMSQEAACETPRQVKLTVFGAFRAGKQYPDIPLSMSIFSLGSALRVLFQEQNKYVYRTALPQTAFADTPTQIIIWQEIQEIAHHHQSPTKNSKEMHKISVSNSFAYE